MLSEQITVTATPTSIYDLLVTARGSAANIPKKCIGIKLRCLAAETATISLSDANSGSGAIVLAANTESLVNVTFKQFNIDLALLTCSSGTMNVHLVVEQALV
jgi:hypothetical protein